MSSAEALSEPPADRTPSSADLRVLPGRKDITPKMAAKARLLRFGANVLSIGRLIGGGYVAYKVAQAEYPPKKWNLAAGVAALALTDLFDGVLARRASAIDGQKSPFGAWADQMSDKVLINGLMAGLTYANYREGNSAKSTVLGVSTAVTMIRDGVVTYDRIRAEQANVGVDTAARKSGKVKLVIQAVAATTAVSPLVNNELADTVITTALAGSTIPAVTSGIEYHNAFNEAVQAAQQAPLLPVMAEMPGALSE